MSGDPNGLGGKLWQNWRWLRAFAARRFDPSLIRTFDPSDIVQNTFEDALQSQERLRDAPERTLRAWLKTRLLRNLRDAERFVNRNRRDPNRELQDSSQHLERCLADSGLTPDEQAQRREEAERIVDILRKLPPRVREATRLRLNGLSIAEITAAMNEESESAVANLYNRGLATLKRKLEQAEGGNHALEPQS